MWVGPNLTHPTSANYTYSLLDSQLMNEAHNALSYKVYASNRASAFFLKMNSIWIIQ